MNIAFKRVKIYRGHVIISDGNIFMMFNSNQRFKNLDEIRSKIDTIEGQAEDLTKGFDLEKFRKVLIDYKLAHIKGSNSALDDATKEFHRGSFIAVGYILNLLKKGRFYNENN